MATTYLQAVNEVLADSNEVELSTANFSSAVGIQSVAKNGVNRAYMEVCAKEVEWPFLRAAESNVSDPYDGMVNVETSSGVRWYLLKSGSTSVASDYAKIDWDSFFITESGATGKTSPYDNNNLEFLTYQDWLQNYRKTEQTDHEGNQTYGEPARVIQSKDGRYFGLSPIPNGAYLVYYTAWKRPTKLSLHSDTILIPDEHIQVLYSRASYYLNKFKGDVPAAQMDNAAFEKQLREMRRALMGQQDAYMRSR